METCSREKLCFLVKMCLSFCLVAVTNANLKPSGNLTDNKNRIEEGTSTTGIKKSAIVVGAGIAGLTVARSLTNSGKWDVSLLEARKARYGGRVWTDRVLFHRIKGVEADLGHILFDSKDVENEMVKKFGEFEVMPHSIRNASLIDGQNQKVYRGDALNDIMETYQQILSESYKIAKESIDDISLQTAINQFYKLNPNVKGKLSSRMFSALTMAKLNLIPSNVSYRILKTHKDLLLDTVIEEGFQEIADRLLSGIGFDEKAMDLELNKVVRQIRITSNPSSKESKIQVRSTDRTQRLADAVIVAVPIGVLKSGDIIFEPPLPKEKIKAIQSIGIGTVNNIIFEFRQVFWPKTTEIFYFVPPKTEDIGLMTTWVNTGLLSSRKDPYLTTFIQGKMAAAMENYTDDQIKEIALHRLKSIFQVTGLTSMDIVSIARSQWNSDSFSKGFFSYPPVGSSPSQWNIVSQPICPHIFFAGEHTHQTRYGTVQGAYLSGLRAAEQVLKGCKEQTPFKPEISEVKQTAKTFSNVTKDEL